MINNSKFEGYKIGKYREFNSTNTYIYNFGELSDDTLQFKTKLIKNMLSRGLSHEDISIYTGMPIEEVIQVQI